jgi:hypothetical protein
MKKYKLIKLYPDSPKLGTVITKDKKVYGISYYNENMSLVYFKDTIENKRNDFKNFLEQFAVRIKKPLEEYLPTDTLNWFRTL